MLKNLSASDMAEHLPPDDNDKLGQMRRQLKQLKQQISELSKRNYELERDVRFFDQRIGLLINHKKAVEELSDLVSSGVDRQICVIKDELQQQKYGHLFYLLQTEPYYVAQLTRTVSMHEIDNLLQPVMFSLYGNQYEPREEYLLLTMFEIALTYEVDESESFNSLLRANTAISRMMTTYTRRGPGQEYLKLTLEKMLTDLLSQNDLVLEINPVKVYVEIFGCPLEGSSQLTMEKAMDSTEVQDRINNRITKLIEIASQFLVVIIDSLDQVPYGIRWLCSAILSLVKEKYPEASQDSIISLVGGFFLLRFLNPAIVSPHAYMLVSKSLSPNVRRNLTLVAKLFQSMANKHVGTSYFKEEYMQPLQPFALAHLDGMQVFLHNLGNVLDFHENLEMEHYLSLSKDISISVTLNEVYRIHELILKYRDDLALTEDDPLHILVDELGPPGQELRFSGDVSLKLTLTSRWNHNKVLRVNSVESTRSRIFETGALKEQCRPLLLRLFSMEPSLLEEQTLLEGLQRATCNLETDAGRLAEFVMQRYHLLEEFQSTVCQDKAYYKDLKQEVQLKLLHYDKLESRFQSLQRVYETLDDHGNYLKEQLDAYKEYLTAVRTRAASVTSKRAILGSSATRNSGPVTFSYSQLEKDGVVIEDQGIPEKRIVDISVVMTSPDPGVYHVALHYKGQSSKAHETDIHLEELLELQHLRDPVLYLNEFVVLDVQRTLLLLHKHFAATP